jgi:hypothetical protein
MELTRILFHRTFAREERNPGPGEVWVETALVRRGAAEMS